MVHPCRWTESNCHYSHNFIQKDCNQRKKTTSNVCTSDSLLGVTFQHLTVERAAAAGGVLGAVREALGALGLFLFSSWARCRRIVENLVWMIPVCPLNHDFCNKLHKIYTYSSNLPDFVW